MSLVCVMKPKRRQSVAEERGTSRDVCVVQLDHSATEL